MEDDLKPVDGGVLLATLSVLIYRRHDHTDSPGISGYAHDSAVTTALRHY